MKVRCTKNSISEVENKKVLQFLSQSSANLNKRYDITPGNEYEIFWIEYDESYPFFFVFEDNEDIFPLKIPSGLFEIVDQSIPDHWVLSNYFDNSEQIHTVFGPKFLADNRHFLIPEQVCNLLRNHFGPRYNRAPGIEANIKKERNKIKKVIDGIKKNKKSKKSKKK